MDRVVLASQEDAEKVLDALKKMLIRNHYVTVSDLYDLCGLRDSTYRDARMGWIGLGEPTIIQSADGGFILNFAEPIDLTEVKFS